MSNTTIQQGVLFKALSKKPTVVRFDQEHTSTDGGALLLKACDKRLGLSAALSATLCDKRQQSKIRHSYQELFQQRLFGLACGYADGNDAARIANDPVFKLLADRDPIQDPALGSQPTLSRFENAISNAELLRVKSR